MLEGSLFVMGFRLDILQGETLADKVNWISSLAPGDMTKLTSCEEGRFLLQGGGA